MFNEINTFIAGRGADGGEYPRLMSIAIPQGNRWTQTINISEGQGNKYKGELELVADGLPKGVTMIAPRVPKGAKQTQVQFVAAANTPPQAALISIRAKAVDGSPLISHAQQGFSFINHSGGAAWNSFVVDHFALAVTDPAPFSVEFVQPQIPLSKNGELAVQIKVARKPGFDGPLEVQCDWLPPSVGCEPIVTIPAGQSEAVLHLSADANAQPGTTHLAIPISTVGSGDYELGRVRASSAFIDLIIAEPYVALKSRPGSVRRGGTAQVVWKWKTRNHSKAKPTQFCSDCRKAWPWSVRRN